MFCVVVAIVRESAASIFYPLALIPNYCPFKISALTCLCAVLIQLRSTSGFQQRPVKKSIVLFQYFTCVSVHRSNQFQSTVVAKDIVNQQLQKSQICFHLICFPTRSLCFKLIDNANSRKFGVIFNICKTSIP